MGEHASYYLNGNRPQAIDPGLFEDIRRKQRGDGPYQSTVTSARTVQTDMDEFPYRRFFRGDPDSTDPLVFDREAGTRRLHTSEFQRLINPFAPPADTLYCFQPPCSTIFPCQPRSSSFHMPLRCVWISP